MSATQPIGTYRDSVHEVVLGRAGPYGFVVSLVVVTLGLYGLRGTPRSVDVIALILGGAAGVAVAGTLGIRRRGRVSSQEELPERWLDFHPLAVALSAAAGIAVGGASMRDLMAWVVGAAVAGMVYVLVAAAELAFRRRQAQRAARRAREETGVPVALGTGVPVREWRRARRRSIEALVQLDAPPAADAPAAAEEPAGAEPAPQPPPEPIAQVPEPIAPAPEPAAPPPAAAASVVEPAAPPIAAESAVAMTEPASPEPAVAVAEPLPPQPAASGGPEVAQAPRPAPAPGGRPTPAAEPSLRTLLIVAGVAVIGLVLVIRLLRR